MSEKDAKKDDKKKDAKKEGGDKGAKKDGDKGKKEGGDKGKKDGGDKGKKEGGDKGKKEGGKKDDKPKGDGKKDDKPKGDGKKEDKKDAKAEKPAAAAAAAAPAEDKAADGAAAPAGTGDEKDGAAPAAAAAEPLDPQSALKAVLLTSLHNDGLARGLHESVKALDRREAHLCVLSSGCNEPAYVKLITALCSEHRIPLIKVEDSKQLGEWVGLCRRNSEGKAVKTVGCSCAVIRSWGEDTPARNFILDHIKNV